MRHGWFIPDMSHYFWPEGMIVMAKRIKIIMAAMAFLVLFPVNANAQDLNYIYGREMTNEEIKIQQKYEPIRSSYIDEGMEAEPVHSGKGILSRSSGLESSYDTRQVSGISPVRNQDYKNSSYGTCWSFAALGMSESNIMKRMSFKDIDLSEMHLTYFAYHRQPDILGGTKGDFNSSGDIDYRQIGGNAFLSVSALASWMGPVDETVLPYDNVENPMLNLPEDMAYSNVMAHLQNSYWVSMQDKDIVKEMIKEYGSVQVSFRWNSSYYNYSTASYYKNTLPNSGQSHAVVIAGWDDNYSASNFKRTPDSDGAWLVKNSWGDKWGDGGYFWMSYEDVSVCNATAFVYDYDSPDNYDYNYQYDGTANLFHYASYDSGEAWMANVFNAESNEALRAVSFYLLGAGMEYDIQIYTNLEDGNNPVSGTAYFETPVHGSRETMGYYTVKLDKSVPLNRGENFAVVVKLTNNYDNALIPLEATESAGYEVTAYSEPGQSFISYNGIKWNDRNNSGNVRIKAFTDKITLDSIWGIEAQSSDNKSVEITWDGNSEFDGYLVYRKDSLKGSYKQLADISDGIFRYIDTQAEAGAEYYYTVKGYRFIDGTCYYGRDSYGVYIRLKLGSTKINIKRSYAKGIKIIWKKTEGASGYCIYRSSSLNGKYSIVGNVTSGNKQSYIDGTVKKNRKYYYKIRPYRFNKDTVVVYGDYSGGK